MDVRVALYRKMSTEDLTLLNCGVGEDLRVPWAARRSNQSILKEIISEYSLEGLVLKLKLQDFGYLMWRFSSLEKTLMMERLKAGAEGDDRGRDGWMASLTHWTWVWVSSGRWWRTGKPGMLHSMGSQRVGHDWTTQQEKIVFSSWKSKVPNTFHCSETKVSAGLPLLLGALSNNPLLSIFSF